MTGNEYQELAMRTVNKDLTLLGRQNHALHGMVGEIGEIHSMYQKIYQGHGEPNRDHLIKEIGDLLWFIAEFCSSLEIDMEDVMHINIEKLKSRFPNGFEIDKSINRKVEDI